MGIGTLRRYHERYDRLDVDTKVVTAANQEAVKNITQEQLDEKLKNPAFAKAFEEELAAEKSKQLVVKPEEKAEKKAAKSTEPKAEEPKAETK